MTLPEQKNSLAGNLTFLSKRDFGVPLIGIAMDEHPPRLREPNTRKIDI